MTKKAKDPYCEKQEGSRIIVIVLLASYDWWTEFYTQNQNSSGIWSRIILKGEPGAAILSTDNLAFGSKNMLRICYFFPQQQALSPIIFNQISEPSFASTTEILFQVAVKIWGKVKYQYQRLWDPETKSIQSLFLH